jgi:hypothetical protein
MPPQHSAGFKPDPQIAETILKYLKQPVSGHARRIVLVEDSEAHTIKARQPVKRRQPDITVARLQNAAHGVLREAIFGRPVIETVLGTSLKRE